MKVKVATIDNVYDKKEIEEMITDSILFPPTYMALMFFLNYVRRSKKFNVISYCATAVVILIPILTYLFVGMKIRELIFSIVVGLFTVGLSVYGFSKGDTGLFYSRILFGLILVISVVSIPLSLIYQWQ